MPVLTHGTCTMIFLSALGLISSIFGAAAQSSTDGDVVRRVVVRDEVIFRIPIRSRPPVIVEWVEHKGPKCFPAAKIAGALLSGPQSLDFVLTDRTRIRAKMDSDCQALDYYGRLYLQPADAMVCAKREEIKSRVGGACRIERLRLLTPKIRQ